MNLYHYIYNLLDQATPLKGRDCGKLCSGACCDESEEGEGMYLFPLERQMFVQSDDWFTIDETDFCFGEQVADIFICTGKCKRNLRPLSCRIFPLIPHRVNGKLELVLDPRGATICPFVQADDMHLISPEFYTRVRYALKLIDRTKDGRIFIDAISEVVDEFLEMRNPK